MIIKDDVNFLKNPNWVVSKKDCLKQVVILNNFGSYEMKTSTKFGLPVRLDKTILYYLKSKLFSCNLNSNQIQTTRYEIAKNVFVKSESFSQAKYQRIMVSLERWKEISLIFNKSFYEKDNYVDKSFSIIDDFEINQNKKLLIKFNDAYIDQIRESSSYKMLDFYQYRNLRKPISLRLYEILLKNLSESAVFYTDIKILADNITLQRKSYESQILASLQPAVNEINNQTNLKVEFQYDRNLSLCIFKKSSPTL
jgi:hypothetical protein